MSARILWLWLATREYATARTYAVLLAHFGRAEQVYAADRRMLAQTPGLTKAQVNALCDKDTQGAEKLAAQCDALGISLLTIADAAYPDRLRQIADPPIVLYVHGTLPDLDALPGIAIVGTRGASAYGASTAQTIAGELAEAGFVIVTGMARGVDGAANRGALRAGGKTVAVLGCGVNVCYPSEHQALMGDILLSGAVISEYPPGTRPLPQHFPVRNRIMSGLCVGTLVIEAGMRSGALITAREALDQGRDVFAVPGNIDMESFKGSNALISRGEAMLLMSSRDLVREYAELLPDVPDEVRLGHAIARQTGIPMREQPKQWSAPPEQKAEAQPEPAREKNKARLPEDLSAEERIVCEAVIAGAELADEIVDRTGIAAPRVGAAITMLEIDGVLVRRNGRLVVPDDTTQ